MKNKIYMKAFTVGISILVIGFSNLPSAISKNVSIYTESIEKDNSEVWGLGFILCRVTYFEIGIWIELGLRGQKVKCIDLDTGEVVSQGKTRIFGFFLFKFLPIGHDYKIIADTIYGEDSKKVEDLFLFQKVTFTFIIK